MKTKLINFLNVDIWRIRQQDLSTARGLLIKYLKIVILSIEGFIRDQCPLRASALTLYSMLSIVPVFAMLFGIAKGFGFEKKLEQQIIEQIPQQETMMVQLIGFAEKMLASTKGGLVAGIGLAVLFFTVIKLISNIEESFNEIWKVKKGRTIGRKISDYLSMMLLAPLLLILSSSLTVYVKTEIAGFASYVAIPDYGTAVFLKLMNYSSWVIMWILFSFTLIFVPNTKVSLRSGILAGVISGTCYMIVQSVYITLQVGVSSYNAIYGTFAALPLFVIWLQVGWLIFLLGSEISYYHQNIDAYRHKKAFSNMSFSVQKIVALQISHLVVQRFVMDEQALSETEIAIKLDLPVSMVHTVLNHLVNSGILVEVRVNEDTEEVFHPAKDTSLLTISYVIDALENSGCNELPDTETRGLEHFVNVTQAFREKTAHSEYNQLLKEI